MRRRRVLDLIHPSAGSARLFGLDSRRDSVAIRARLGNLPGDFGYGRQCSGRCAPASSPAPGPWSRCT
ncbi:MAG TPA: hypothetical protein VHI77_11085 [Solirubrobacterales bacterium]|nr:hypothetical protein [Solirubrobacterales bacterium]